MSAEHRLHGQADVSFKPGTSRVDHGLVALFKLPESVARLGHRLRPEIDIGGSLFKHLSFTKRTLAASFLPRQVQLVKNRGTRDKPADDNVVTYKCVLNQSKVSKGRVVKELQALIDAGDHPGVLHLKSADGKAGTSNNNDNDNFHLKYAIKPSTMLYSFLRDGQQGAGAGAALPDAEYAERDGGLFASPVFAYTRWLMAPLMALVTLWMMVMDPEQLPVHFQEWPRIVRFAGKKLIDVLPPHPTTFTEAFKLGAIQQALADAVDEASITTLLERAQAVVGRTAPVTLADMAALGDIITQLDNHEGLISRVTGFFTFVNIMWLIAILGITLTVGPFIWVISGPFRRFLRRVLVVLATEIKRFVVYVTQNLIIPTLLRLHTFGVYEVILWCVSLQLIADGLVLAKTPQSTGLMISLGGLPLTGLSLSYSTFLHVNTHWARFSSKTRNLLVSLAIVLYVAPLAIHHESRYLALIVVLAFYSALGLSFGAYGLCYVLGFSDSDTLAKVADVSLLVLSAMTALRATGSTHLIGGAAVWKPFSGPLSVVAALAMHLAFLIVASLHYRPRPRRRRRRFSPEDDQGVSPSEFLPVGWGARQLLFIGTCAFTLFSGSVLRLDGLFNTSASFAVLYAIEKWNEIHFDVAKNGPITFFFPLFVCMYYAAKYLHEHPEIVTSVFSLSLLDTPPVVA